MKKKSVTAVWILIVCLPEWIGAGITVTRLYAGDLSSGAEMTNGIVSCNVVIPA
jgi:hypothetical protein